MQHQAWPAQRRQLFEFEDQAWLPAALRDSLTDILRYHLATSRLYEPAVARLRAALEASGCDQIVDIGSGAGGPIVQIQRRLAEQGCPVTVTLTDKFPHRAMVERIRALGLRTLSYHAEPVDALHVPPGLRGVRTLFTCFHHFAPPQAAAILRQAVADRAPIAIFEFTTRSMPNLLGMLLAPLAVLAQAPAIFRHQPARLLWVYVVPLIPLIYWWDGIISYLRTYSVAELAQLLSEVGPGEYTWDIGTLGSDQGAPSITYLVGWPA